MQNRQAYQRAVLRVEHPQLEQPASEYHSARKLFGNRKNRLSPEFSYGDSQVRVYEEELQGKHPQSGAKDSAPQGKLAEVRSKSGAESARLQLLKAQLQRKNEEIRRLLQNARLEDRTTVASSTAAQRKTATDEPFAKAKSLTPLRQRKQNDSAFACVGPPTSRSKPQTDSPSVHIAAFRPQTRGLEADRRKGFADCGAMQLSPPRNRRC